MPNIIRYAVTIQHEVIVYAYSSEAAKAMVFEAYPAKPRCINIRELPPVEVKGENVQVIDNRVAPGQ